MGPPPPAGEEKIVIMKAVGGEIGSASALAPKLGPLGLVRLNYFVAAALSYYRGRTMRRYLTL
jgi:hypothetical protein